MVMMNETDENEKSAKRAAPIFIPPKPSCRKPIKRTMDAERSPKRNRAKSGYSNSPIVNRKDYSDGDGSDVSEATPDDEDYDDGRDSVESECPCYEPERAHDIPFETVSRQRKAPTASPVSRSDRQNIPKTPGNVAFDVKNAKTYGNTMEDASRYTYKSESTTFSSKNRSKAKNANSTIAIYKCIGCVFVIGIVILYVVSSLPSEVNSSSSGLRKRAERLKNLQSDFTEIKRKFPTQDDRTWRDIQAGITAVIKEPQKPWMFVLFSNETKELSCLAEYLGNASSKALHSEKSLSLNPENLGDDYGEAIERWKFEIREKKAVVVHDLLNIDPKVIQAFHSMCDKQNPLVEGAVYIMTIITPDYIPGSQTPEEFVENQLINRFINKIPNDKLHPLITRLMDGAIIPVAPEISLNGCPFS